MRLKLIVRTATACTYITIPKWLTWTLLWTAGLHRVGVAGRWRTVAHHPVTGRTGRCVEPRSFGWREAAADGAGRMTAGLRVGHGWTWRAGLLDGGSERR